VGVVAPTGYWGAGGGGGGHSAELSAFLEH
jgi:hypothetical protein